MRSWRPVRGSQLPRTDQTSGLDSLMKGHLESAPLRRAAAIARWRTRSGVRAFVHDSLHTAQGRIVIATLAFALLPVWQILHNRENILEIFMTPEASPEFTVGGILLGEGALLLGFLLILPIILVKEFVVEGGREVLRDHPLALPEEAVVRAAGVILWLSVFLWSSFHLFYLNLLLHPEGEVRWLRILIHAASGILFFLFAGAVIALLTRWVLTRSGNLRWAVRGYPFAILPFIVGYSLFLYLPNLLAGTAPGLVSRIGEVAPALSIQPILPVAAWNAAVASDWQGATGWVGVLLVMAVAGGVILWRWRTCARADLLLDTNSGPGVPRALAFMGSEGSPRWKREFRVFWIKDIVASARRSPIREVRTHALLVFVILLGLPLLTGIQSQGEHSLWSVDVVLSAMAIGVSTLLTMRYTLGRVGTEGAALLLLRPSISPLRLLAIKIATGVTISLVLSFLYALLIYLFSLALGIPMEDRFLLLMESTGAVLLLAPPGIAIGFILPDTRGDGFILRGASGAGKLVFAAGSAPPTCLYLMGRWLSDLPGWPTETRFVGLVIALFLSFGLTALLIPSALRIYSRSTT